MYTISSSLVLLLRISRLGNMTKSGLDESINILFDFFQFLSSSQNESMPLNQPYFEFIEGNSFNATFCESTIYSTYSIHIKLYIELWSVNPTRLLTGSIIALELQLFEINSIRSTIICF